MEEQSRGELCSVCATTLSEDQKFCTHCGFPERGTEEEKSRFHAHKVIEARDEREAKQRVSSARTTLYVVSGLMFLGGLIYFFIDNDISVLITYIILSVIYLILGYWSQSKPLIAIILGLLVYLTLIVLSAIADPTSIFSNIIIRIIIIVYLAKGVYSASAIKKA